MYHTLRLLTFLALMLPFTRIAGQSYNPAIDVQHYEYNLQVNDDNNKIIGQAAVTVDFKESIDSIILDLVAVGRDGKGMKVLAVKKDDFSVKFTQRKDHLVIHAGAKAHQHHTFNIRYEGIPADGLIISNNKYGHRGFFGDNWPNRAHNWLPCVDHPSDKATVDFHIIAPDHYTVVANGALQEEKNLPNHLKSTHWKESSPLSPKIMVVGIADFVVDHPGDAEGIPVFNYVFPESRDSGFHSYAHALEILPFYIHHIGPYPFEKCGNVQSKTRFGGLENASAIFYFENSVSSPDVESLMAHEIAHQWFGDAVTETDWPHIWLSEGFATYMTHCYLENKYGPDTLRKGMANNRTRVIAFEKKRLTPVVDSTVKGDYMQLLNANSYGKGGWVLHMLRRKIGDTLFWKGISIYYITYRNRNASSEDLEKIMEEVSGQDLHTFFHQWLYMPGHPSIRIKASHDVQDNTLVLEATQLQPALFEFSLDLSINGVITPMAIKDRTTRLKIPMPSGALKIVADPNVDVLGQFEVQL